MSDQYRQRYMLGMRDLFQVSPEGLFKADAGLVSTNYDGTFNDRRFHYPRAQNQLRTRILVFQRTGGELYLVIMVRCLFLLW